MDNNMIQERKYLTNLIDQINDYILKVRAISDENNEAKCALKILQDVVDSESELRKKCGIGVRFNVIRTQLQSLLKKVEDEINASKPSVECDVSKASRLNEDETVVYVYLFNAKGAVLKTWQNLLLPSALIDHSVNRPIYINEENIKAMLRSKQNKEQHAYVEIAVKKEDIIASPQDDKELLRDNFGFSLAKLKYGALKLDSIKRFIHNNLFYKVSTDLQILPV